MSSVSDAGLLGIDSVNWGAKQTIPCPYRVGILMRTTETLFCKRVIIKLRLYA